MCDRTTWVPLGKGYQWVGLPSLPSGREMSTGCVGPSLRREPGPVNLYDASCVRDGKPPGSVLPDGFPFNDLPDGKPWLPWPL